MRTAILLPVAAALLILTSCKSRKVAISSSDSISHAQSHSFDKSEIHVTDSTKTSGYQNARVKKVILKRDSGRVTTVITPVPGTISTVDAGGTFHGQALHIKTTEQHVALTNAATDISFIEAHSEITGIDSTGLALHETDQKQSTDVSKKAKTVDAQADHGYIWVILGIVALVLTALYFWWRSFYKPVSTVADIADKVV